MRLFTFSFFLAVLSIHQPAEAQSASKKEVVNVSAQIVASSSVDMLTLRPITLDASEAVENRITINPKSDNNAGKMIANGTPNADIRISFQRTQELTQNKKSAPLTFKYNISTNTEDNQTSSEILIRNDRDLKLNNNGHIYLWIGGNINIAKAVPGNYHGNFALEIEYI